MMKKFVLFSIQQEWCSHERRGGVEDHGKAEKMVFPKPVNVKVNSG
jgi:hypothetical protein